MGVLGEAVLVAVLLAMTSGQTDRTREAGAVGSYVVEAVLDTLNQACIFADDRLFLRRLAFVETRDGTDPKTYRPGYDGGIWQVDRPMLNRTHQQGARLTSQYRDLKDRLNIDWSAVTWSDLRKPLYSGIAAALYLLTFGPAPVMVPPTLDLQGVLWERYYRQGTQVSAADFVAAVQHLNATCYRDEEVDVAFVVPSTSDMSTGHYDLAKHFVSDMVSANLDSHGKVRVAFVSYSDHPRLEFGLAPAAPSLIQSAISRPAYMGGSRDVSAALNFTMDNVFNTVNQARPHAARVLVLLLDGPSNDNIGAVKSGVLVKSHGSTSLYVITVGPKADQSEASLLASLPTCSHLYHVTDFSQLASLTPVIARIPCKVPIVLQPGDYNYPCGSNVLLQLKSAPVGSSMQVSLGSGEAEVFGSYSNPLPNRDVHDVAGRVTPGQPLMYYVRDARPLTLAVLSENAQGLECDKTYRVKVTNAVPKTTECNGHPPDIEFLVDTGTLHTTSDVRSLAEFLSKFVDQFEVGPGKAQFGLATYSSTHRNHFWLKDYKTSPEVTQGLQTAMASLTPVAPGGPGSNLAEGLRFVREHSFTPSLGVRPHSQRTLVLVAGPTPVLPAAVAREVSDLETQGVRVVSVTLGQLDPQVMAALGSVPLHLQSLQSLAALPPLLPVVTREACGAVTILCLEQGMQRNCSTDDILASIFGSHFVPDENVPNPCNLSLGGLPLTRFPHPLHQDRFLECDSKGEAYVVLCPAGEEYDPLRHDCERNPGGAVTSSPPRTAPATPPPIPSSTPPPTPPSTQPPTPPPTTPSTHPPTHPSTPPPTPPPTSTPLVTSPPAPGCNFSQPPCSPSGGGSSLQACPGHLENYVNCTGPNQFTVQTCPAPQLWDDSAKKCGFPFVITNATTGAMDGHVRNPCKNTNALYTAFPANSTNYVECRPDRIGILHLCDPGLVWDDTMTACV